MMVTLLLAWAATQTPAPPAALPPATVALVETYADGRVNYELTSAKPASMWTPFFPRMKDWQAPADAVPLRALKLARVLAGRDVRVDVSLLGPTYADEIAVASVVVRPGAHVAIKELRKFGVEPVDLSLAEAAPLTPYLPTVFCVTPSVEIAAVDLLNAPYPGYRVTVRNLSDRAAANFHVQSYRGENKALSSVQRGPQGRPALTPGGSYTFDVNLTGGRKTDDGLWAPTPLDVIEIDSVLWDDGTMDGPPDTASLMIPADAGRRLQFTRIVDLMQRLMKDGDTSPLTRLRAEIDALPAQEEGQVPAAQAGMRAAKQSALDDLTRFERDRSSVHDADDVGRWLAFTVDRYKSWIKRLAQ